MEDLKIGLYYFYARVFGWTPAQVDESYLDAIWALREEPKQRKKEAYIDELPGW